MKIQIKEFNVITGEETLTEREETAAEKKERENAQAKFTALQVEAEAKTSAKADLLEKLGITTEEAALLLL